MTQVQIDVSVANRFIASLSKSLQALCHGCMEFDSGIEIIGYINLSIDSGSTVDCVLNEKVLKSTAKSMTFVSNSFLARKERPEFTQDKSCSISPGTAEGTRNWCTPLDSSVEAASHYDKRKENEEQDKHRTSRHEYFKKSQLSQEILEMDRESLSVKQEINVTGQEVDVLEDCQWSVSVKQEPEMSNLTLSNSDNDVDIQPSAGQNVVQLSMPSIFRQDISEFPSDREVRCQSDELSKEGHSDGLQCETESSHDYAAQESQQLPSGERDADAMHHDIPTRRNEDMDVLDMEPVSIPGEMNDLCRSTFWNSDKPKQMQAYPTPQWEPGSNQLLGQNCSECSAPGKNAKACRSRKKPQHCLFCQQTFASHLDYHQHLDQFHRSEMPFTCSLCGRGYLTANGLHRHAMVHAGKSFPCPVCSAHFNQKQNMKRHLGNIHRLCQCPICSKTFSTLGGIYKEHLLGCHRKMNKPKTRLHYHKHLDQFHRSEMPFTCSLCGRGYFTANGLHRHAMVHAGKSFPCPVCSAHFNQKENMKRHLGNIHRLCQCPICSKTFSTLDGIYKEHLLGCHRKMDKPKTRIK